MDISARMLKQLIAMAVMWGAVCTAWADPPSRVGRVSLIEGSVKFYADQEEGWQPARLNFPVTSENSIWTEGRSRAEWKVGPTAIRLDHDTVVDIQKLDDTEIALYLQRGGANIRIGIIEKGEVYRIFTPEGTITLRARGSYRIEADLDKGETRVAVHTGRARIESRAGSPWIDTGRMLLMDQGSTRIEVVARTDFDDWVQALDDRWNPAVTNHVSPYMTGHEDLDTHGTWEEEPEYGRIWIPRVVVDWVPYRYGHWRYVRPWGWTWIDDAPWGFAATHYGRWVQVRGRWAWWPGTRIHRPVYSPALVAWVGGSGWNVTYGTGIGPGIGWFPLAPYEPYIPWYQHSPTYIYNINHIHINRPVPTRPPRQYVNHKPGVTIVTPATFQSAVPVAPNQARLRGGEAIWNQPAVQDSAILPPRRATPASTVGSRQPGMQGKPFTAQPVTPTEAQPLPPRGEVIRPQKPVQGSQKPATNVAPVQVPAGASSASMGSRAMPGSTAASGSNTPAQVVQPDPGNSREPQPRYNKPRVMTQPASTSPQPAPVIRDAQIEIAPRPEYSRPRRPERTERVDRARRAEKPQTSEPAVVRPQPAPQPPVQAPTTTPTSKPVASTTKEPRDHNEPAQQDRSRNSGRTQER